MALGKTGLNPAKMSTIKGAKAAPDLELASKKQKAAFRMGVGNISEV